MAYRLYIMPISLFQIPGDGGDDPGHDARKPKYSNDFLNKSWAMIDYGFEDTCLICIDVTPEQHTVLSGYNDVLAAPEDITGNPGPVAVDIIKDFLATINVPSNWVNTSRSWRTIIRIIGGVFRINQRYLGIRVKAGDETPQSLFREGIDLNRTFSSLPNQMRADLQTIAFEMDIDTSGITGQSTLGEILQVCGLHFAGTPMVLIIVI